MNGIKAVIFDMDGLMFDTERLSAKYWIQAGKEQGLSVGEEFLSGIRGSSKEAAECKFYECFDRTYDYWAIRNRKTELFRGYLERHEIPLKEGLRELLLYLREHQYKVVLATSTARYYALQYLKSADVEQYFNGFVCGDMVTKCKPDPEIFFRAAALVECTPNQCVVLEDSLNGIRAAIDGGFIPVMVPDITQPGKALRAELAANCKDLFEVIAFLKQEMSEHGKPLFI